MNARTTASSQTLPDCYKITLALKQSSICLRSEKQATSMGQWNWKLGQR